MLRDVRQGDGREEATTILFVGSRDNEVLVAKWIMVRVAVAIGSDLSRDLV